MSESSVGVLCERILVTAIIPTLAEGRRRMSLFRAIDSLKSASKMSIRIVVVVNGERFDKCVIEELEKTHGVDVLRIRPGSLPLALEHGRRAVATPFYCFLDDDDVYLHGAIDDRLRVLEDDPSADLVVANGYLQRKGQTSLAVSDLQDVLVDPLRSLFRRNWLGSCSGLFRSDRVSEGIFEDVTPHTEWTWIAFRLARAGKRIAILDKPTFLINETEGSASKSENYRRAYLGFYRQILSEDIPADLKAVVKARMSDAWHDLSCLESAAGKRLSAWKCHLASLLSTHGLRYLPYTRHLLR